MPNLLTTLHASIKTTIPADTGILISVPSGGTRTFDELSPAALVGARGAAGQGFNLRGSWAANTAYAAYDVVTYGGSSYTTPTAFTSGATFSAANWTVLAAQGLPGASGTGTGTVNTGTTGQLAYYAAGGTVLSSLALGTGLSVSSGTLNVAAGGGTAGVSTFNTRAGTIVLTAADVTAATGTGTAAASALGLGSLSTLNAIPPSPSFTGGVNVSGGLTIGSNGLNVTGGTTIASGGLSVTGGLSVSTGTVSLPAGAVGLAALAQGAATLNQVIAWTGTAYAPVTLTGSYTLPVATTTQLGGVKSDNNTVSIATDGTISVAGLSTGALTAAPGGPVSTDFYSIYRSGGTATDYKAPVITADGVTMTMSANGVLSVNTVSTNALPAGAGLAAGDKVATYSIAGAGDVVYTAAQITAYTQSNFQSWSTAGRLTPAAGRYVQGFNTTLGRFEFWNGTAWNQHNRVSDWSATATQLYAGSATPGVGTPITLGAGLALTGTTLTASGGGGGSGAPANTPQTILQYGFSHNTPESRAACLLPYKPSVDNTLVGFVFGSLSAPTGYSSATATPPAWTNVYNGTPNQYQGLRVDKTTVNSYTGTKYGPNTGAGNGSCQGVFEANGFTSLTIYPGSCTVSGTSLTATIPATSTTSKVFVVFQHDDPAQNPTSNSANLVYLTDFGSLGSAFAHGGYMFSIAGSTTATTATVTLPGAVGFPAYAVFVFTP